MDHFAEGLRCQDVTLGLREVDPRSAELRLVQNTHLVGMAADLAGLIRGRNVIESYEALEIVASETLDIPAMVLPQTLEVLELAGFVEVDRTGSEITRVIETVPIYQSLYSSLGTAWRDRSPRQIEEELVVVVDRLSRGPIPVEELTSDLGVDKSDVDRLYRLGLETSVFQTIETIDGSLLYSPYMAFEHPQAMYNAVVDHGSGALADALHRVAGYQGYPVDALNDPILAEAISRGIISAPAVALPDQTLLSFATLPYAYDRSLTRDRKPVLDKALAIIACVRCGQHFGGATNARDVAWVLSALRDREYLQPHSSHQRQYKLLRDNGVIQFLPDSMPGGSWVRPSLIQTDENLQAIDLAISLVSGEEILSGRESEDGIKGLLGLDAKAIKPLQVTARSNTRSQVSELEIGRAFTALVGQGEL